MLKILRAWPPGYSYMTQSAGSSKHYYVKCRNFAPFTPITNDIIPRSHRHTSGSPPQWICFGVSILILKSQRQTGCTASDVMQMIWLGILFFLVLTCPITVDGQSLPVSLALQYLLSAPDDLLFFVSFRSAWLVRWNWLRCFIIFLLFIPLLKTHIRFIQSLFLLCIFWWLDTSNVHACSAVILVV